MTDRSHKRMGARKPAIDRPAAMLSLCRFFVPIKKRVGFIGRKVGDFSVMLEP
jgi:hypothetical protein